MGITVAVNLLCSLDFYSSGIFFFAGGEGGGAKFRVMDLHWTLGPPLAVHTKSCFISMTTLAFSFCPCSDSC